ncbi:DUF1707 domain-containing protein [Blastococcus sp. TF02A_35]|uniref:DUF1707 SHOCT-like domain-containing protein n=1 Tax=Blastococcus sp. TF02A-35 TaxID=2559612 RepID=UPI0010745467|nr:DUF1707 domain-containing protein [Blastococcus sp. TF02A_35]TFV52477.1 DUF1707 and DUF2154 domain-containing protein [Blastococcus sp. TF02A_35]
MSDDADLPAVRASDADREAIVSRLQTAVGEGRIDLDEFTRRTDAAYSAVTTAELDRLVHDLPAPAEIVGNRLPAQVSEVFADVLLAGAQLPPSRVSSVFGDVRIDLRGLRTDHPAVDLRLTSVFGDIDVIVSEGVDAVLEGSTVFGNRKVQLAPVPRVPGTPRVTVHARNVFGNLRLRSLAPGEPASHWRAVLGRLEGGRGRGTTG